MTLPIFIFCFFAQQLALSSAEPVHKCAYTESSIPIARAQEPIIIPGFEKCGTTELFHKMYSRGCFRMGSKKELKFLSRFCLRGLLERKVSHSKFFVHCKSAKKCNTLSDYLKCWSSEGHTIPLDGTPAYSHTILLGQNNVILSAAQVLKRLSPTSKSIWLIRNPVDRAISSFHFFMKRRKYPGCTLQAKIVQEKNFLKENSALVEAFLLNFSEHSEYKNKLVSSWALLRQKFRNSGEKKKDLCPAVPEILIGSIYLPMLAHWVEALDTAQHLVLSSESFFMQPEYIVSEVVEPFVFEDKKKLDGYTKVSVEDKYDHEIRNKGKYEQSLIDNNLRCMLHCVFAPYNAALINWLEIAQKKEKIMLYPQVSNFAWLAPMQCSCG